MGYCITMRGADFFIKAENKAAALAATEELAKRAQEGSGGSYPSGQRWFSWMNGTPFDTGYTGPFYDTLEEVFAAWGYPVETDDAGNIVDIMFDGDKIGDEEVFFQTIAPYVQVGSCIEMEGEDGALWRWWFDGEGLEERAGRVVFD